MSDTPKKGGDLRARLITAIVAIPLLLLLAIKGPNWGLWALIAFAATAGVYELLDMTLQRRLGVSGWAVALGTATTLTVAYWTGLEPISTAAVVSATVVAAMILELFTLRTIEESGRRLVSLLASYVYAAVLFGGLLALVATDEPTVVGPHQDGWLFLAMGVIWSGDTGAYFAGRAFGRRKLAPRVSPKKTWEGAIGGLIASVVGAYLFRFAFLPHVELWHVAVFAVPGAILGQIGDLCESLIKRATGFKDSGVIVYGHGGMLDRVDALIFAAPYFAVVKHLLYP